MSLFLSSYENRLDTKGRISVPASFRAALNNEKFVLSLVHYTEWSGLFLYMNKCVTLPSNNIISVMAVHNDLGRKGEDMAAEYLQHEGYCILARNWVNKGRKELDIVATKDDVVVFVEVKTRRLGSLTSPIEAVDARKQHRICMAADSFLKSYRAYLTMSCFCRKTTLP